MFSAGSSAQSEYYRHVIFDNSGQLDIYWHSTASATAPSTLAGKAYHLPVESTIFHSPPNALRIEWKSLPKGGWDAEIHPVNFPNRFPELEGHTLFFWLYAPEAIAAADLPQVVLSDAKGGLQVATTPGRFTVPEPLGEFTGDIPAGRWVQVRIALAERKSASVYSFRPERLQSLIFHQGRADGAKHVLIVDDIRIDDDHPASALPPRRRTSITSSSTAHWTAETLNRSASSCRTRISTPISSAGAR